MRRRRILTSIATVGVSLGMLSSTVLANPEDVSVPQFGTDRLISDPDGTNIAGHDRGFISYDADNDRYLAVWRSNLVGKMNQGPRISARLVNPDGSLAGNRVEVSRTLGNRETTWAGVAHSPQSDRFLVAWVGDDTTNNEFEVHGRLVNSDGSLVGSVPFQITSFNSEASDDGPIIPQDVSIAFNSATNQFYVVFASERAGLDGKFRIYGLTVSPTGLVGPMQRLDQMADGLPGDRDAQQPDVVYGDGEYLVVWDSDESGSNQSEVWARVIASNGVPSGDEFRVSDATTGDTLGTRIANDPSVAYSPDVDRYLVGFSGDVQTNTDIEVFTKLVNPNGSVVGGLGNETVITNTPDSGDSGGFRPDVVYNTATDEFLVFATGDQIGLLGAGEREILVRRVTTANAVAGDVVRVSKADPPGPARDAERSAAAYNSTRNEIFAVWQADVPKDGETNIWGNRIAFGDPPSAPTGVSATAGNAMASVSWSPPATGGPFTSYTVTSSPGGKTATVNGATTTASVGGLTNGVAYTFTVVATNGVGQGELSNASNAVTPKADVPQAPTAVKATAGNGQASVSWKAPTSGPAPTQYVVTTRVNGVAKGSKVVNGTSTVVSGLTNGTAYTFTVRSRNAGGDSTESGPSNAVTPLATIVNPAGASQGYWMLEADGQLYWFGDEADPDRAGLGVTLPAGVTAVAMDKTPSGLGLFVLGSDGVVYVDGDAANHGNVALGGLDIPGEKVAAISATPDGGGYWVFTDRGRALNFGSAGHFGDLTTIAGADGVTPVARLLNGPVIASVATPDGLGYYMIASDGGVFALGTAKFQGSMGGQPLNQPVVGIAPDPDGVGYWLVAADGGIFAFEAPFRGSVPGVLAPGVSLNRPVIGAIAYGQGYLMVASDGGIFDFSPDLDFLGSLGSNPPNTPIVGVAAFSS